ncbi:MAG TPA: ABC transporter ATP-binding protein [Planctomycetota bacterium]|nr:ABC transporter ATP-binding protein [Planctomycetota bacterium]
MSSTLAVVTRDLKKGFGEGATRIEVLRGVNLEARSGEILMLVGPSGCGKTTLLSVISGLLDSDGGEIEVFGQAVSKMSASEKTEFRKKTLGFVFQQFNLIPTLTAAENAAVPLLIHQVPYKQAVAQATEVLNSVGMGNRVGAPPAKLSGGEQQRVAIARALVAEPKLLICDEPTASLDGETGQHVMEILRNASLREDRCIIVVTHDSRIFKFGDRIVGMRDGRIESVVAGDKAGSSLLKH